jgi:hypothetical protein
MDAAMRYLALVLLLIAGCKPPTPVIQRVEVMVPVPCPAPAVIPRPPLPIQQLKSGDPSVTVKRAYVATVEVLIGYARELEKQLDAYRKK